MTWQTLVRDWLRQAARQRLGEAASAKSAGQPELLSEDPAPASHVAVVFGEMQEAGGLIDRLDGKLTTEAAAVRIHEGGLHGRRVALVVTGTPVEMISDATLSVIEGHRPRWVIVAGFATALSPQLARGDALLADELIDVNGGVVPIALHGDLMASAEGRPPGWRVARILSADGGAATPAVRRALGQRFGALAAEVHSAAAVEACRRRDVPHVVLRIVRQGCDEVVPRDVGQLQRKRSLAGRIGVLAGIVLNRPSSFKVMWNEKEQDLIISDRLAQCLTEVIQRLVPSG